MGDLHTYDHPCLIGRVRDEFGWLGNMSPHPVIAEGVLWPTAEALFQALRFAPDDPIREVLAATWNPMRAKMLAKTARDRHVLEPQGFRDVENMFSVIVLKLEQHPEIRAVLRSTGDRPIVEDVTRRRNRGSAMFWGAACNPDGTWEGRNQLGRIWMSRRREMDV